MDTDMDMNMEPSTERMTIDVKPEHQRLIERALQCGAFHDPQEVIGAALELLTEDIAEDLHDVRVSRSRQEEQGIPLDALKADLIRRGKLRG